jgi:hypothetical protein
MKVYHYVFGSQTSSSGVRIAHVSKDEATAIHERYAAGQRIRSYTPLSSMVAKPRRR